MTFFMDKNWIPMTVRKLSIAPDIHQIDPAESYCEHSSKIIGMETESFRKLSNGSGNRRPSPPPCPLAVHYPSYSSTMCLAQAVLSPLPNSPLKVFGTRNRAIRAMKIRGGGVQDELNESFGENGQERAKAEDGGEEVASHCGGRRHSDNGGKMVGKALKGRPASCNLAAQRQISQSVAEDIHLAAEEEEHRRKISNWIRVGHKKVIPNGH